MNTHNKPPFQLIDLLKRYFVSLTVAGVVVGVLTKMGIPDTVEEMGIFLAVAAFGLLAARQESDRRSIAEWQTLLIQNQRDFAVTVGNHLGTIEKSLAVVLTSSEELRAVSTQAVQYMGVTADALRHLQESIDANAQEQRQVWQEVIVPLLPLGRGRVIVKRAYDRRAVKKR